MDSERYVEVLEIFVEMEKCRGRFYYPREGLRVDNYTARLPQRREKYVGEKNRHKARMAALRAARPVYRITTEGASW